MKRLFLAAAILAAALGSPAQATDVGEPVKFNDVRFPPIAGCTDFDDAYELEMTRPSRPADDDIVGFYRPRTGSICLWLRHSDDEEWRVMEKTRTKKTAPDLAWFCVKPIGDVGDTQVPCLWLRWIDKR